MTRTEEVFAKLTRDVPGIVYHYCGPDALAGIVQSRQIWATSADHLNDLSERAFAADLLRSSARNLAIELGVGLESYEATPVALLVQRAEKAISYVSSFSEHGDLLSQWRAYSPPTGGFAVGVRTSPLTLGGDWLFGRCEYNDSSQADAVRSILQDHAKLLDPTCSLDRLVEANDSEVSSFIAALLTLVPLLKHPGFREEAEWRVVRGPAEAEAHATEFRVSQASVIPYQPIDLATLQGEPPIAEVVIGPSPDARHRSYSAVRMLLDHHGFESCDLRISEIPYRG